MKIIIAYLLNLFDKNLQHKLFADDFDCVNPAKLLKLHKFMWQTVIMPVMVRAVSNQEAKAPMLHV